MPIRIQSKRTKGWKMPESAVYVGRPTRYGNRFRLGGWYAKGDASPSSHAKLGQFIYTETTREYADARYTHIRTRTQAVEWFRWYMDQVPDFRAQVQSELRGKNLACWCPLDQPCHADVLLEIANQ